MGKKNKKKLNKKGKKTEKKHKLLLFALKQDDVFELNNNRYIVLGFKYERLPRLGDTFIIDVKDIKTNELSTFTRNWAIK